MDLLPQLFQPPRRHLRRGQGSFHRHGHCRRLQRPTFMNFYGLTTPLPSAKSTPSPVRPRGAATSPFQTNYFVSSDHRLFISALTSCADTTTPPLPAWNAFPYLLKTTLSFSFGPFLEPLHHRFPQRSWPYQDRRPACTIRTFTARQLRIREPATPRDGEPSSQGIIEFSPPRFVLFLPPLPPLTIVFISLEYVFSFGF